ncbi:MAG: replication initiation protein [Verrucomicrobia bacterium]|nr:replication initiation protein [Verrucomicrobiota bacterium]
MSAQPTRESLVWQRNQLAEARYKLSPREQKLLLYVIAMIEPEAADFGKCKVSVRDFAELTGLKADDLYQELRDTALAIREKTLVVENVLEPGMRKPVRRHGSWFEYVDEAVGDGCVTVKLSSWLKPLLIHVRSEFFRYRLGFALNLRSEYSIRLYQWLKRWQFLGRKTQSVAQLRLELGATEVDAEGNVVRENLSAYKHFKNKAITPAVKEINEKTDLAVSFKEEKVKGSKAVASVTFFIKENLASRAKLKPIRLPDKSQMELDIPVADDLPPTPEEPTDALAREFGLSRSQTESVRVQVADRGLAYVQEKAAVVRSQPRDNLGRAFMAALKGDWQMPKASPGRKVKGPGVEPDGWREWVKGKYPDADVPASWRELCDLFPSVRDEFLATRPKARK